MSEGLDFEAERVAGNSVMANAIGDMTHWNCTLSTGSSSVSFVVSLALEDFGEQAPTKDDAVAFLLADLETLDDYPDRGRWLQAMARDTGIAADSTALAMAHEVLTETMAGIELNFDMNWRQLLEKGIAPNGGPSLSA